MPDNVIQFTPRQPRRTTSRRASTLPAGLPLADLIDSWQIALQAANKSPNTIVQYTRTARVFVRFLAEHGLPGDAERVQADHVRRFLVAERERASAQTAAAGFRNLSAFFRWIITDEERSSPSPVLRADLPQVPKKARRYLGDDDLTALLGVCRGSDFAARRDTAIIRIFIDNGVRVSGLAGMRVGDLDLKDPKRRCVLTRLKGGEELWAPIGAKAAQALDRYLRIRAGHRDAASTALWLGRAGAMTASGVRYMLRGRGEEAGIEGLVHPHRFRGTFAHEYLKAGGSERGAMLVAGWKSREMLYHYTEGLAADRAREEHARLAPGDRV